MQMNLFTHADEIVAASVSPNDDWNLARPLADGKDKTGIVYTKAWVVDLMLDLAGYTPDKDLASLTAVEPAAGEGAFLVPMVKRFIQSCRYHQRPITDSLSALLAYELDPYSSAIARQAVECLLAHEGIEQAVSAEIASVWVRTGDYLRSAKRLPADFVIGNPPYIRLEEIPPSLASAYRRQYPTMIGRADIYVAFFEAALKQLKQNGVCAFICADRWMLNQYGAELRRLITAQFGVEAIIEMHGANAFDTEVNAYPAVTIIRRTKQQAVVVASADFDAQTATRETLVRTFDTLRVTDKAVAFLPKGIKAERIEGWFQGTAPWPCVSPERLALLKRLEREFAPLESPITKTKVGIGVASGCDQAFITSDPNLVESERLLPLAMASDLHEGKFQWGGRFLVSPWETDGLVDLSDYPRLAAYYNSRKAQLMARNVAQRRPASWYRTIDRIDPCLLPKQKLYIPDIKDRLRPILDAGTAYPHHNLYFVQSEAWDMEVLGGLLLSDVGQFFVKCYGVKMRGGYFRFQAQYLRRIRVPKPEGINPTQTSLLIDAFQRRDIALATRVAFALYGIDDAGGEIIGS